jgi:lauroyl/myristoyl acyltransferase
MTSYRLEISDKKWNKFKDTLSKNQTINQVIESWIDERIEEAAE